MSKSLTKNSLSMRVFAVLTLVALKKVWVLRIYFFTFIILSILVFREMWKRFGPMDLIGWSPRLGLYFRFLYRPTFMRNTILLGAGTKLNCYMLILKRFADSYAVHTDNEKKKKVFCSKLFGAWPSSFNFGFLLLSNKYE